MSDEVTIEECQEATRGAVLEMGELVLAPEPVPVEVWDPILRDWFPGQVTAWRGTRVSTRYTTAPGMTYMAWLPARAVRRLNGEDAPAQPEG